jgi:YDG domain
MANGTLDVFAKNLTFTAAASNKVYDGTSTATVAYSDDRVPGDLLSLTGTAAFSDKNVASGKTVNVTGITINGADAANYTLVATSATAIADITARDLTVSATAANRMYDGTTSVSVTYGDNRLTGDVLTVNGLASFADKNVGTGKAVTITNITITGIDSVNYALTSTTASTTADIIAPDGDLDGSGVSVTDALRALRIAGGLITPTAADSSHGDVAPLVSGTPQPDGSIDIGDAVVILRKAVGLVNW